MKSKKAKYSDPVYWVGVLFAAFLVLFFVKCSIETIRLTTNYDYTIAQVYGTHTGDKMEPIVDYSYVVNGKSYDSGAERDGPFKLGARYVVRYGKFDPQGNKFYADIPVPDSIQQDTGKVWRDFLRRKGF